MHIDSSAPLSDDGKGFRTFSRGEASDYVYPLHTLDGAKYQHCLLTLFIRFNDILDPEKIQRSLKTLLETGDWKKLGGRFRTKHEERISSQIDGGRWPQLKTLEIHVPRAFTAERPAVQFAHEEHNSKVTEHSIGHILPQASNEEVLLSPPLDGLRQCGLAPGFPTTMDDLVDKDAPQLCFKVISFLDATILAVTFSHCSWDISGLQGFMKSLELVLAGREDEVPSMLGGKTDILSELASQHHDSSLDPALLNMVGGMAQTGQPRAYNSGLEERILRVPLTVFQRLHEYISIDSPEENEEDLLSYQPDELFLALLVQQIARSQSAPRPLKLLNIFNARLLVPQIAKSKGIYSQNLVLLAPQILDDELAVGPILQTVLAQRECFAQAAVPKNVTRSLYTILGAIKADIDITGLANSGEEESVLVNNLVRLSSYIDVDLSPAVVRQGDTSPKRRNGLGTADLCFLTLPGNSYGMMRITTVGSYNGNACWLFGELPPRAWEQIYEALAELEI